MIDQLAASYGNYGTPPDPSDIPDTDPDQDALIDFYNSLPADIARHSELRDGFVIMASGQLVCAYRGQLLDKQTGKAYILDLKLEREWL